MIETWEAVVLWTEFVKASEETRLSPKSWIPSKKENVLACGPNPVPNMIPVGAFRTLSRLSPASFKPRHVESRAIRLKGSSRRHRSGETNSESLPVVMSEGKSARPVRKDASKVSRPSPQTSVVPIPRILADIISRR
jgi:hypothetical protein